MIQIPGTNAEKVKEICTWIRAIAQNYPTGLPEIRRQLDAVDPVVMTFIGPEETHFVDISGIPQAATFDAEPVVVTLPKVAWGQEKKSEESLPKKRGRPTNAERDAKKKAGGA